MLMMSHTHTCNLNSPNGYYQCLYCYRKILLLKDVTLHFACMGISTATYSLSQSHYWNCNISKWTKLHSDFGNAILRVGYDVIFVEAMRIDTVPCGNKHSKGIDQELDRVNGKKNVLMSTILQIRWRNHLDKIKYSWVCQWLPFTLLWAFWQYQYVTYLCINMIYVNLQVIRLSDFIIFAIR